jgi:predicted nucleotidyltransferase
MSDRDELLAVLRTLLPQIRLQWPIRSLAVFGSVARGEAGPQSDLDILVEFNGPVSLSRFLALEDSLSTATGRRVELVSRNALKPFIERQVLRDAVAV